MNCRRGVALAAGLMISGVGCTGAQISPMAMTQTGQLVEVQKVDELPKRPPKASTLIAYGGLCERSADEPKCPPAQRERLRDQARRSYQQALGLEPKNVEAMVALANLYVKSGDKDRAILHFQKAVKQKPKDAELWFHFGLACGRLRDWTLAQQGLKKATELDPENKLYQNYYGYCLARTGQYEESLKVFCKVNPEAEAHYNLARMLHHLQDDDLSKEHLRQALKLNPHHEPARELLAQLETAPSGMTPVSAAADASLPIDLATPPQ